MARVYADADMSHVAYALANRSMDRQLKTKALLYTPFFTEMTGFSEPLLESGFRDVGEMCLYEEKGIGCFQLFTFSQLREELRIPARNYVRFALERIDTVNWIRPVIFQMEGFHLLIAFWDFRSKHSDAPVNNHAGFFAPPPYFMGQALQCSMFSLIGTFEGFLYRVGQDNRIAIIPLTDFISIEEIYRNKEVVAIRESATPRKKKLVAIYALEHMQNLYAFIFKVFVHDKLTRWCNMKHQNTGNRPSLPLDICANIMYRVPCDPSLHVFPRNPIRLQRLAAVSVGEPRRFSPFFRDSNVHNSCLAIMCYHAARFTNVDVDNLLKRLPKPATMVKVECFHSSNMEILVRPGRLVTVYNREDVDEPSDTTDMFSLAALGGMAREKPPVSLMNWMLEEAVPDSKERMESITSEKVVDIINRHVKSGIF